MISNKLRKEIKGSELFKDLNKLNKLITHYCTNIVEYHKQGEYEKSQLLQDKVYEIEGKLREIGLSYHFKEIVWVHPITGFAHTVMNLR